MICFVMCLLVGGAIQISQLLLLCIFEITCFCEVGCETVAHLAV